MQIYTAPHLKDTMRWQNMRIGLLGGSFNPPHEGHVHISLEAMRTLKLDVIWWLVTPWNPLKTDIKPLPLEERMTMCKDLVRHPRILISDIEKDLGTNITYFTVKKLKQHFPKTDFVWLTGMDNALSLHKWNYWKELLQEVPTAHITRLPAASLVQNCPLRLYEKQKHVRIKKAARVPLDSGHTYWLMQKKMVDISSTAIRQKQAEKQQKQINNAAQQ